MAALPPPGRYALGMDAQAGAEALLAQARTAGMRTAWLGPEAGFVSNLSVMENLRLMHDWHDADPAAFESDLAAALAIMHMPVPDWLHLRPAQAGDAHLVRARLLRVLLLTPDAVVVNPLVLALAGDAMSERLLAALAHARLFLLADPRANWPRWPAEDAPSDPAEDNPA